MRRPPDLDAVGAWALRQQGRHFSVEDCQSGWNLRGDKERLRSAPYLFIVSRGNEEREDAESS